MRVAIERDAVLRTIEQRLKEVNDHLEKRTAEEVGVIQEA